MPRSTLLKQKKTNKKTAADNLRKQKFAIWDYYKKKKGANERKGKKQ